jgi:hypothetical protein
MRRSLTITTAALAITFSAAAGPAHAASAPPPEPLNSIKAVVVLIGANDYGLTAPPRTVAHIRGP